METQDQWIKLFKSLEFFEFFDDDQCREGYNFCEIIEFSLDEYIIKSDQPGVTFFVLLKGAAQIVVSDSLNVNHAIGQLAPGDCFGEMAILLKETRAASIRAGEGCYALQMSFEGVEQCTKDTQIEIYRSFGKVLSKRLKTTTQNKWYWRVISIFSQQ